MIIKYSTLVFLTGVFLLTAVPLMAQNNNQGVGLRIGDPLGITYKVYVDDKAALEFVLGSVSRNSHEAYYKDTFRKKDKYDDYLYSDHDVDMTIALMGRYLIHESFPANVDGRLDWYYGGGVQLRISKIDYQYFDEMSVIQSDNFTNLDLGPEAILGVEYELSEYPIVGFGEVSLLMELIDRPFHFRFFGAIGVRYAFRW